jgi:hypothetical protein
VFVTVVVCAPAWLIFSDEPGKADNGAVNPLALVVPVIGLIFALLLFPQVLALVRRPVVAADHYALTVRPGVARTLVLPWAQIAEVAAMDVDDEPILLVRCAPQYGRSGDWPRWWDKAHLRSAKRSAALASAYDLAVPMNDFYGTPQSLLADLARWAPAHVAIVNGSAAVVPARTPTRPMRRPAGRRRAPRW